jgi:hypothetical protein
VVVFRVRGRRLVLGRGSLYRLRRLYPSLGFFRRISWLCREFYAVHVSRMLG